MRRDLVTGRERRAVSVQGGSVAPQVSPDGKTLAYVRRVRLEWLFLRDLESGRDRELFATSTRISRKHGPSMACIRSTAGRRTAARS